MAFTQITSTNITANTVVDYATYAAFAANVVPKVTTVNIANSTYSVLDDTAVNIGGGYLVITGSAFQSGAQVLIDVTSATSTTFINSTTLRAQVPAKSAASYNLYVVNPDGGTATKINGITYSGTPTWVTGSTLANVQSNNAFTGSFSATGATSYAVSSGSTLPTGLTLVTANGYYYGNISVGSQTTYSFSIDAIDAENQESPRTFSLTTTVSNVPTTVEYIVVAGGGGGNRAPSPGGYGGGGGAGGLLTGNLSVVAATTYTVTVGGGGNGGSNGTNSVFSTITSWGGGAAGHSSVTGQNGGSGGGGRTGNPAGQGIYPGSSFISAARQGYDGKTSTANYYDGGGGGGAGQTGGDGTADPAGGTYAQRNTNYAFKGGDGLPDTQLNGMLQASSSGEAGNGTYFIAGGGGGGRPGSGWGSYGGYGGGGTGAEVGSGNYVNTNAMTNTGGGGGCGNYGSPAVPAGSGGSGLVIIRYSSDKDAATSTTGSPTVTTSGGYRYYKFTASGSITF